MRSFVYLASPYTDPDEVIMQERYEEVCGLVAFLIKQGHSVYSPIVHNHYLAEQFNLPKEASFWETYDEPFIYHCSYMLIAGMDGWEKSVGITHERAMARTYWKKVYLYDVEDLRILITLEG